MQQISKVKDTAALNQKAPQSCSFWKGDIVCCSLYREVVCGIILMAVVLLMACVRLLGTKVQVFCENMTGMMCD